MGFQSVFWTLELWLRESGPVGLLLFDKGGNWGTDRLSNLPRAAERGSNMGSLILGSRAWANNVCATGLGVWAPSNPGELCSLLIDADPRAWKAGALPEATSLPCLRAPQAAREAQRQPATTLPKPRSRGSGFLAVTDRCFQTTLPTCSDHHPRAKCQARGNRKQKSGLALIQQGPACCLILVPREDGLKSTAGGNSLPVSFTEPRVSPSATPVLTEASLWPLPREPYRPPPCSQPPHHPPGLLSASRLPRRPPASSLAPFHAAFLASPRTTPSSTRHE